jgi:hypothetical protein
VREKFLEDLSHAELYKFSGDHCDNLQVCAENFRKVFKGDGGLPLPITDNITFT